MRSRDLASLAFKLLGVWFLLGVAGYLTAFFQLPSTLHMAGDGVRPWMVGIAYLLGIALQVAIGTYLLARAERLGARLVPEESSVAVAVSGEELQGIAFSLVAVYLICDALPRFVQLLVSFAVMEGKNYSWAREGFVKTNREAILSITVQLLVGVGLFLGSRRLAALWHKVRYGPEPASGDGGEGSSDAP